MGPELPNEPAKHQCTDPPGENREHVPRATRVGMSHQGKCAQHAPGEQSRCRYSPTPPHHHRYEIRGPDVDTKSAHGHSEEGHQEPEKRVGDSNDTQSKADSHLTARGPLAPGQLPHYQERDRSWDGKDDEKMGASSATVYPAFETPIHILMPAATAREG
jgi:hypothetical protein